MVIDETLAKGLLNASRDNAALVRLKGRAQVLERSALESDRLQGAAVRLTRAELVDLLGRAVSHAGGRGTADGVQCGTVDKLGA
ncbi:hypothetical protein ABZS98_31885 [Streptomyces avermitilis]|uniref:hypothetical protein n=1 Tax=Streptomyces avermitilis TaxID=33903 RepID=UPI0033AF0890